MGDSIGREFMEKTRHEHLPASDQQRGLLMPPLQLPHDKTAETIELPHPMGFSAPKVDIRRLIEQRTSVRQYSAEPLTLEELSYLLWCTQGVKEVERSFLLRTVPSAGARHAFETYLLVNRVSGLDAGLYRFIAVGHRLLALEAPADIAERITQACFKQSFVRSSAATFIWAAVPYRMEWRYCERAYRYLHLDAGHVCQNLYLAAEAIDAGVCAIAAFTDEDMARLLDLDGVEQFVIYLATVGKKPSV